MKIAAIIVATAAAATPGHTQPEQTRMVLSPEDAARCQAQGGCGIVTRVWVLQQMQKAYEAGKAECKGAI